MAKRQWGFGFPSFNLSGTKIFYQCSVGGDSHIFSMDADGTDATDLTPGQTGFIRKIGSWVY